MRRSVGFLGIVWCFTAACGGGGGGTTPDSATDSDAAVSDASGSADVVTIESGSLRGVVDGDLVIFKGIPYATAPRFAPPTAPAPWTGIRDATQFGPACPQPNDRLQAEACLSLNVWAHTSGGPRPVIVWIHGGGYTEGASADAAYDAADLARRGDVVVVSINYRLGVLGFLALPQLAASDGGTGNWGLRDQIAALAWVHRYIAAFGGNPAQVLIAGESAGGASICTLLAAPSAQGLYTAAAMQSGTCRLVQELQQPMGTFPSAYAVGVQVAVQLGCTSGDIAACLRNKPLANVVAATTPLAYDLGAGIHAILPVIDGVVLDKHPMAAIRGGRGNVPLVAGANRDDMSLFMLQMGVTNASGQFAAYLGKLNIPMATQSTLLMMYPPSVLTEVGAATAFSTDVAFGCPARALAAVHPTTSRLYQLDRGISSGPLVALGAVHGLDFADLFGTFASFQITPSADDLAVHAWFASTWGGLARGQPDAAWTPAGTGSAYLSIAATRGMHANFRGDRCAQLATLQLLLE
jgi:para-nitrobenzyl esterase